MLKRSHVRHFLALVDAGSFTQAAQRMRVTQPTLSAGIADLERIVSAKLFIRDRKGLRLTDAGGSFVPIARDLEHRFRKADNFGCDTPSDRPTLRLGTLRTVSGTGLQTLVAAFAGEFNVELSEGTDYEIRATLAADRIDLALTILRPGEESPVAFQLFEEPYVMMVPISHRFAGSAKVRPDELATEVMIARRACEVLTQTSRFFTRSGVRPRFAFKSDSDERCLRMVAAGLGITTAPLSLAIKGVHPLAVEGYDMSRRIGLVASARVIDDDHTIKVVHRLVTSLAARFADKDIAEAEPGSIPVSS